MKSPLLASYKTKKIFENILSPKFLNTWGRKKLQIEYQAFVGLKLVLFRTLRCRYVFTIKMRDINFTTLINEHVLIKKKLTVGQGRIGEMAI